MLIKYEQELMKLSCIISTLNASFNLIKNAPDCEQMNYLSNRYINYINKKLLQDKTSIIDSMTIINSGTIHMAHTLLCYFNKQKLVLGGYNYNNNTQIEIWINEYLTNKH